MRQYVLAMRWLRCQLFDHLEPVALMKGRRVIYVCPRCGSEV